MFDCYAVLQLRFKDLFLTSRNDTISSSRYFPTNHTHSDLKFILGIIFDIIKNMMHNLGTLSRFERDLSRKMKEILIRVVLP